MVYEDRLAGGGGKGREGKGREGKTNFRSDGVHASSFPRLCRFVRPRTDPPSTP